jgi:hypothetical protein
LLEYSWASSAEALLGGSLWTHMVHVFPVSNFYPVSSFHHDLPLTASSSITAQAYLEIAHI